MPDPSVCQASASGQTAFVRWLAAGLEALYAGGSFFFFFGKIVTKSVGCAFYVSFEEASFTQQFALSSSERAKRQARKISKVRFLCASSCTFSFEVSFKSKRSWSGSGRLCEILLCTVG